jgi:hypothetical protein
VFSNVLKKASQNHKLQRKYQLLNSGVVVVGVLLAFPVWIGLAKWSRLALGIPLDSGSLDGMYLPFLAWIVFFLFITVFVWLIGIILVAAFSTLILIPLGRMKPSEAPEYIFRSVYPRSWYKSAARKGD